MKVLRIEVDEIPKSCGDCMFMKYINDWAKCCALPDEINDIAGNPYDMNYRRSDCPLSQSAQRTPLSEQLSDRGNEEGFGG